MIRLSQPRYLDTVEQCVTQGSFLLIENLPEEIDPVLEPLLGRSLLFHKGKFD